MVTGFVYYLNQRYSSTLQTASAHKNKVTLRLAFSTDPSKQPKRHIW